MSAGGPRGLGGWLLVYLVVSLPLLMFHSMGLSGWFFDYPFMLMVAIFLALAFPLLLIVLKSPGAPMWNIAMLWIVASLVTLRSVSLLWTPVAGEGASGREKLVVGLILAGIVLVSIAWAVVWTRYFTRSVRVGNTFTATAGADS